MTMLSIGKSTYDITIPVEEFPIENTKITINEKLESSGGSASNVAYLLGKWNLDTYFAGVVGYDDFGSTIKKELESVNVHTNFMEVNYERKTSTTFIIANKKTTSRTQIMIEPEKYHLKKYEYDINPKIIYADGFEYSATMAAINKFPNAITVLGAGLTYSDSKEVLSIAKYVKYIIFSLDLAEQVIKKKLEIKEPMDPQAMLVFYKELKNYFPNNEIVITLKRNGVLYAHNNNVQYMPTIKVEELDRTGSGDIFDGAFVYSLAKGYDMETSMRIANIAAGLSTTKHGGKSSIPILSDVIKYYESKFGPLDKIEDQNKNTQEEIKREEKTIEKLS